MDDGFGLHFLGDKSCEALPPRVRMSLILSMSKDKSAGIDETVEYHDEALSEIPFTFWFMLRTVRRFGLQIQPTTSSTLALPLSFLLHIFPRTPTDCNATSFARGNPSWPSYLRHISRCIAVPFGVRAREEKRPWVVGTMIVFELLALQAMSVVVQSSSRDSVCPCVSEGMLDVVK